MLMMIYKIVSAVKDILQAKCKKKAKVGLRHLPKPIQKHSDTSFDHYFDDNLGFEKVSINNYLEGDTFFSMMSSAVSREIPSPQKPGNRL
eukprot:CAMPEP_0170567954 /NCGR_PEP_ID=MMETSP0211-20121228/80824_1 /TAXON_ID=311385 /ORGANISM="Pseudokeronopsis sp., Strain OXSARD2" /LENGTH=89 /DNA_ID=CAMNT_0010889577 /DNA_START=479 /DNA_END=748 /DNA_ORIENTATION=+